MNEMVDSFAIKTVCIMSFYLDVAIVHNIWEDYFTFTVFGKFLLPFITLFSLKYTYCSAEGFKSSPILLILIIYFYFTVGMWFSIYAAGPR